MSEIDIINKSTRGPVTISSIQEDLKALGLEPGMTVIVHSALSRLGWVCGGAPAVILALEQILGEEGTLVMPTHSGDLSDPEYWENPPVPEDWHSVIRSTMPAFDVDLTPTRGMGAVPECFRKQRGVLRSSHPHFSFAAWGALARKITEGHSLDYGMGEKSPLAKIYQSQGWILLLGVGHENNSSLHLAEYRAEFPGKKELSQGAPVIRNGQRQWLKKQDLDFDDSDFPKIGRDYQDQGGVVQEGRVGYAQAKLIPQQSLVDYAVEWMETNR